MEPGFFHNGSMDLLGICQIVLKILKVERTLFAAYGGRFCCPAGISQKTPQQ
jgi:hypothetical protein